jgi:hypothetical protein
MNAKDETTIALSRGKLVLLVLASCAFVALGAWLLTRDAAEIQYGRSFNFFGNNPLIVYALGLAAVLFFGLCGLYGVRKMFDRRPGLVLNGDGLVDNASAFAAGFIPWSEVTGSSVYEVQNQKMLVVGLSDPGKYAGRGGALRRALNRANSDMSGSPVAIPASALAIDFQELVELFDRYHRKYGGA